jgi:hypothetical protein
MSGCTLFVRGGSGTNCTPPLTAERGDRRGGAVASVAVAAGELQLAAEARGTTNWRGPLDAAR